MALCNRGRMKQAMVGGGAGLGHGQRVAIDAIAVRNVARLGRICKIGRLNGAGMCGDLCKDARCVQFGAWSRCIILLVASPIQRLGLPSRGSGPRQSRQREAARDSQVHVSEAGKPGSWGVQGLSDA